MIGAARLSRRKVDWYTASDQGRNARRSRCVRQDAERCPLEAGTPGRMSRNLVRWLKGFITRHGG